jgi:hypothetical protein
VTRSALGAGHLASARNELHLGRLQFYVRGGGEGLPHLRHAHGVLAAHAGRLDPLELLEAQTFLANALVLDGRLQEAGPVLDDAVERRRRLAERAGTGVTLDISQARWLADTGQFAPARLLLERLRDAAIAQLGAQHPSVADRRVRLAQLALAAQETAVAERELLAALATQDGVETVFGSAKHRAKLVQALLWVAQGRAAQAAGQADALLALAAGTPRGELYRETFLMLHEAAAIGFASAGRHADAAAHLNRSSRRWPPQPAAPVAGRGQGTSPRQPAGPGPPGRPRQQRALPAPRWPPRRWPARSSGAPCATGRTPLSGSAP